jgi:MarR family transcriptional regulator, transcriptional regulator for hemolysin
VRPRGTPIGRKLAMTAKAVGTAFNAALAVEGGSAPTWLILNSLRQDQWTAQLDLARSLGIESPTLTRHLDNLERNGLVIRRQSEEDRRAVRVELTEAGEETHRRMLAAVIAFNRRLQAGIDREELQRLEGLLDRLAENVSRQSN